MTSEALTARSQDVSVLDFYTKEEQRILREVIAPGIPEGEFRAYLTVARATGLDPVRRQIYPIMRWDKKLGRERMTIQTGIDGFRAVSSRQVGRYAGLTKPEWCGQDGVWREVWLEKTPPRAARIGVLRHDFKEPCWGVVTWDAYVQTDKNGNPTKFWAQMAPEQLVKCAEAVAHRKAFPEDLSGVYTSEEMAQADREPREAVVVDDGASKTSAPGVTGLKARAKAAAAEAAAESATTPSEPQPASVDPGPAQEATAEGQDLYNQGAPSWDNPALDPSNPEGLEPYRVWESVDPGPWADWCDLKMAEKGPLARYTAAELIQGPRGGGRHQIARSIIEKTQAKYGAETVPLGALRVDYAYAVMMRRWVAEGAPEPGS